MAKGDPKKPKGKMSAYAFFVQTCREEHKKKNPEVPVNFAEFSKKCSERWKTMFGKEKSKFDEMAKADKVRYDREMKKYGPAKGGKKKKDPNAPKRPPSGFFLFCSEFRPKIKSTNPGIPIGDVAKKLGEMWNNLSDNEKQPYNNKAGKLKEKYGKDVADYKCKGKFDGAKGATKAARKKVILIISGNLSFLNWLTIIPSIACFDDAALGFLFGSQRGGVKDQVHKMQLEEAKENKPPVRYGCLVRRLVNVSLGVLIAYLSIPVIMNLLNSTQVMNTSFNPLRIVNTYGAFGSITKERTEVIIQGTSSLDANNSTAVWEEYEFKCKPGDLKRRPCLISPYHYRLDWLMWFAAFQTYEQNEWIFHLAGKLLTNDPVALSLIAYNPFEGKDPPRWIRGEHYKYKFSRPGGKHAAEGKWWIRKRIGPYFPAVNLKDLKEFFKSRDWPYPGHG